MSTKPDIKLVAWVKGDNEYHERGEATVSELVAALIAEGGETFEVVESEPRQGRYGEWEQQEPHIVSAKIEPARCLLPLGRYLLYGPIPVEEETTT